MFDFRQITLFCLEKRFSKHKMTVSSKNFGVHGPFGSPWLRLCLAGQFLQRSSFNSEIKANFLLLLT